MEEEGIRRWRLYRDQGGYHRRWQRMKAMEERPSPTINGKAPPKPVDINRAGEEEWQQLHGIYRRMPAASSNSGTYWVVLPASTR